MKKYLLLASSVLMLLSGCSENASKVKDDSSKETLKEEKTGVTLENLIKETERIRESNDIESYKKIAYPGSPFYEYIKIYTGEQKEGTTVILEETVKTNINLSNYKLIEEDGDLAATSISEHMVSKGETTDFDVEMDYYYIFKKEKGKWKIFDYKPSLVIPNEDKVLDLYKNK